MPRRPASDRTTAGAGVLILLTLLLLVVQAPGASAQLRTTGDQVTLNGCQDAFAPIPASAAAVRRYVPDVDGTRYRILGEDLGVATLVVRVFRCESVKVPGGWPRATVGAQIGVTVESPDGTGRYLGSDACCNWYMFFWVTDNRDFARWLQDGSGLGGVVRYVEHLDFRYQPSPWSTTAAISFTANEPTPSPFVLRATVLGPDPSFGYDIAPNWWVETNEGAVKFANNVPGVRPYSATGEVRTRAGTQMAALFGAEARTFGSPVSYNRWDRSLLTKQAFGSGMRASSP